MTSAAVAARTRQTGKLAALLGAAFLACAGFAALGVWQVKRLAWKEDLIARVDAKVHAQATAAPGPSQWAQLQRASDEYRRVQAQGHYASGSQALVQASTELGPGYWVLTPLHVDAGYTLVVNRGFIPTDMKPRLSELAPPPGEQTVVGLLRFSEPHGGFLRANDAIHGQWYSRDVSAIGAWLGLPSKELAPYFVDAQTPVAGQDWPHAGLTVLHFSNNHLVYALTWFALAAMTAGACGYVFIDERRLRRLSQPCHDHGDQPQH